MTYRLKSSYKRLEPIEGCEHLKSLGGFANVRSFSPALLYGLLYTYLGRVGIEIE
jgi:hypothetical protein